MQLTFVHKPFGVALQFKDNMEMRMKYSDEPSKFMDSEVDLDDAVKRMMVVAGSPELYPDFARTQVLTCPSVWCSMFSQMHTRHSSGWSAASNATELASRAQRRLSRRPAARCPACQ